MYRAFSDADLVWQAQGGVASKAFPVSPPANGHYLIRALDVIVAVLALVALAPLMLIIVMAIRRGDRGPIFYAQPRRGNGGAYFNCLKFRTMYRNADTQLALLLDGCAVSRAEWQKDQKLRVDPRIIPGGAFIRRMSLDELPQLINVLRGEMSIVGPRPIVDSEVVRYGRYFAAYCSVKPGITGLWQISGRNNVSYRRRVACDVLYARKKSASVDLRIIAKTIPAVLSRDGAY